MRIHITPKKRLWLGLALAGLLALWAGWHRIHHPVPLPSSARGITSITVLRDSYPMEPKYQKEIDDPEGIRFVLDALGKVRFTGGVSRETPAGGYSVSLTFHYADREDYGIYYYPEGLRPLFSRSGENIPYETDWPSLEGDFWELLDYPVTVIPPPVFS